MNRLDKKEAIGIAAGLTKTHPKDFMFGEYSELAWTTAIYPKAGTDLSYPALGLAGEAGEVAEKVKKIIRDKNGRMTKQDREAIAKELGDVLWYVNALCRTIGVSLPEVAVRNIEKLFSRKDRGELHGEGDDR